MKFLITLVGPTAVGKTALSIKLARKFDCPILSADSRQFYKGMNIGTAKPNEEELAAARHYFIDSLDPREEFSAGRFEEEAEKLMAELFQSHDQLIMTGGSTLYMDAIWFGFDEMPQIEPSFREALNDELDANGLPPLLEELALVDPPTFGSIDRQNPARVIRALEIFRATGTPISELRKGRKKKEHSYKILKVGLKDERERLYQRIDQRVLGMMQEGLVQEVKALLESGLSPTANSLKTIGYQEFIPYFKGEYDLEEAVRLIQRNSRRYAKRQLTYYRRYEDIQWFEAGQDELVLKWLEDQMVP